MTRTRQVRRTRRDRRRRGVSVFEVLVAFIVLQTGMLASVQMLIAGTQFGARARRATNATLAAQAQMAYVLREVVPTVTPTRLEAAGDALLVPPSTAPLAAPPGIEARDWEDMRWQAEIRPTDLAGLYDVTVSIRFRGQMMRRETATLTTRAFVPQEGGT